MEDLLNLEYAQRLLLEDKQESRLRAMQTITTRVEMIFREGKSDEVFKRLIREINKIEIDFINVSAALYRRAGLFMLRSIVRGISPSYFISSQTSEPAMQPALLSSTSYREQFMQKCVPMFLHSVGDVEAKVRLAAVEGCHELLRRTKLFLINYFFYDLLCALANSIHDRDRQVASLADDVSSVMRELIRGDASFVIDYKSFTKFVITVLEPFVHRHHKTLDEERVIDWVLDWIYFVLDLSNTSFIYRLPEYLPLLLELSNSCNDDTNCNNDAFDDANNYDNYTSTTTISAANTLNVVSVAAAANVNDNDNDNKTTNLAAEGSDNRNIKRAVGTAAQNNIHINNITNHGKNVYYTVLLYKVLKECRLQTYKVIMREYSKQEKEKNDTMEQVIDNSASNTDNDKAITHEISSKDTLDIKAILAILIHMISKSKQIHTLQVCLEWTHELYETASFLLLEELPDLIVKCILPLQDVHNLNIKKDVKELECMLKELICERTRELSKTAANTENAGYKVNVNLVDQNNLVKHIAEVIIYSLSATSYAESKHNKANELALDNVNNNNSTSSVGNNHNNLTSAFSCDKTEAYVVTALEWLKLLHSCCASALQSLTLTLYKHTTHLLANASEKVMFAEITVLCIWSGTEMFDACLENIFHHLHGNVETTSLLLTRLPSILKRLQLFYEDASASEQFACSKVMCKFAQMLLPSSSTSESLHDTRWRCKFVITCQMLLLTADEFVNVRQLLRQCTGNNINGNVSSKNSNNINDKNISSCDMMQTINVSGNADSSDKYVNNKLHQEAHRVFDVLFKSWCVNAISALGLCLVASQFALAWRICTMLGTNEVSSSTLLQLDRLVQLFESPVFTWLRSLLVLPLEYSDVNLLKNVHTSECSKREYLIYSLYAILAILPQSSPQYRSLYTRLKLTKQMANLPFYGKKVSLEANNMNNNNSSNGSDCCHSLNMLDAMRETTLYFQQFVQAQEELMLCERAMYKADSISTLTASN